MEHLMLCSLGLNRTGAYSAVTSSELFGPAFRSRLLVVPAGGGGGKEA